MLGSLWNGVPRVKNNSINNNLWFETWRASVADPPHTNSRLCRCKRLNADCSVLINCRRCYVLAGWADCTALIRDCRRCYVLAGWADCTVLMRDCRWCYVLAGWADCTVLIGDCRRCYVLAGWADCYVLIKCRRCHVLAGWADCTVLIRDCRRCYVLAGWADCTVLMRDCRRCYVLVGWVRLWRWQLHWGATSMWRGSRLRWSLRRARMWSVHSSVLRISSFEAGMHSSKTSSLTIGIHVPIIHL